MWESLPNVQGTLQLEVSLFAPPFQCHLPEAVLPLPLNPAKGPLLLLPQGLTPENLSQGQLLSVLSGT